VIVTTPRQQKSSASKRLTLRLEVNASWWELAASLAYFKKNGYEGFPACPKRTLRIRMTRD